jgi:starvation-inducible DNA-binding protein
MNPSQSYKDKINQLLASYQVHYQNLRMLHWNIKGADFFKLHFKYEELYLRTQVIIDDLAERILALGETPFSTYSEYIQHSFIGESDLITEGNRGVNYVLQAQNELLIVERKLFKLSDSHGDHGTNSLITRLIEENEKTNWMFQAFLHEQTVEQTMY